MEIKSNAGICQLPPISSFDCFNPEDIAQVLFKLRSSSCDLAQFPSFIPASLPVPLPTPSNCLSSDVQSIQMLVLVNPAEVQIVGYNVTSPIVVSINTPFPFDISIQAHLIDCLSNMAVSDGFTQGSVQVLKQGDKSVKFVGLKLAKMTVLTNSLADTGITVKKPLEMYIKFSILSRSKNLESVTANSGAFRIYSNVNQLPVQQKLLLRPNPRGNFAPDSQQQEDPSTNTVYPWMAGSKSDKQSRMKRTNSELSCISVFRESSKCM